MRRHIDGNMGAEWCLRRYLHPRGEWRCKTLVVLRNITFPVKTRERVSRVLNPIRLVELFVIVSRLSRAEIHGYRGMRLNGRTHTEHIVRGVLVIIFTKRRVDDRMTGIMTLAKSVIGREGPKRVSIVAVQFCLIWKLVFGVDIGGNKVEIIGVHHSWENAVLRARHGIHRILVRRHGRGE